MESTGGLPGHAALAEGETLVRNESFGLSIARFFMKTKLALTSERLAGESPNTSFWLIPKGASEFNYPLSDVTAVATYTTRHTFRLIAGLALVVAGLWNGGALWFLSIFGVLLLLTAFRVVLSVTNDVLLHSNMEVSLLDRRAAQRFASQISAVIAARPPVVRSHWFSPELGT